jgi:hypothetical protein
MKFEKGDQAFVKCIGYGLTSYEKVKIGKVSDEYAWIDPYESGFRLSDGRRDVEDPAGLGLIVRLCVTEQAVAAALEYAKEYPE